MYSLTQNICITCIGRWATVEDVGPHCINVIQMLCVYWVVLDVTLGLAGDSGGLWPVVIKVWLLQHKLKKNTYFIMHIGYKTRESWGYLR